jgi:glycosyltransferase involved in cell wall biosynthesis
VIVFLPKVNEVIVTNMPFKNSIVIPAKNEALALSSFLPLLKKIRPSDEIIVVNDGSEDNTSELLAEHEVIEIKHPYPKGNGAAIKSGARAATGDVIIFMDGDGQHQPKDIQVLLDKLHTGYDMVVGARANRESQAGLGRWAANSLYNKLASWMVEAKVDDLTSGFRAVSANKFRQFLYMLPNGFSYPTTTTMAFFRAGYSVGYEPVKVLKREGDSHIKPLKDGIRFLLIIFKICTLYSPFKLFVPVSMAFFTIGLSYYGFTYTTEGRFTNMSMLLFMTSVLSFLIGLVSEQITTLQYKGTDREFKRSTD